MSVATILEERWDRMPYGEALSLMNGAVEGERNEGVYEALTPQDLFEYEEHRLAMNARLEDRVREMGRSLLVACESRWDVRSSPDEYQVLRGVEGSRVSEMVASAAETRLQFEEDEAIAREIDNETAFEEGEI